MLPTKTRAQTLIWTVALTHTIACAHSQTAPAGPDTTNPAAAAATAPAASNDSGHAHGHGHGHGHGDHDAASEPSGHHAKGPLVHRFEKAEDWVPRFESADRADWQKPAEVIDLMHINKGMKVADIGAGTGYFLPYLSKAVGEGGQVFALDVEKDMVRYMNERAAREHLDNVIAKVVPTDNPQLPRGEIDRILIVDTWHHIPDRVAYTKKLAESLAPNGEVFVVDFTKESDIGPRVSHRISAEDTAVELRAGGLDAKVISETLPKQYVVVAKRPSPN